MEALRHRLGSGPGRLRVDVSAICSVDGPAQLATGGEGQGDGLVGGLVDLAELHQLREGEVDIAIMRGWHGNAIEGRARYRRGLFSNGMSWSVLKRDGCWK